MEISVLPGLLISVAATAKMFGAFTLPRISAMIR
jgi:hypothetical protein